MEVDLREGRGAGQADANRRGRPHPAAAAKPLHGTFCGHGLITTFTAPCLLVFFLQVYFQAFINHVLKSLL